MSCRQSYCREDEYGILRGLMAPGYDEDALEILKSKKNRVLLILKDYEKFLHTTYALF